ncbi:MAG: hypothetical protein A3I05_02840 [Deltaproteobacteria bacterium RIFCSPLOWO2_02_FULL_44_10]|nr:MAG: hypothetical protein A3C46_03500 [Deltaproteobacteria bacterium RIFCSPHIGHO2_02_FULL_44_16]OGQ46550.1 MAG: hypothetical protein A3I05_02840 [Deltaproteobacteria bacterium RIFCSPLOWO2_02_FULL_44_10]
MALSSHDIEKLFERLNEELKRDDQQGELYLVGGAVMCLVFKVRSSTKDIDGFFEPAAKMRQAALRVAHQMNLDGNWLNDAVKGYLSDKGKYAPYLELSHLRVYTAKPEYLLAMKCLAMRIGEEFYDIEDVRFLLRYLNIDSYQQALDVIQHYYPLDRIPQKTLYALEEILEGRSNHGKISN